jgi:4-carboxymuconolactone decarboxylase
MMYEALLQSYLFAGFPVALDALTILEEEVTSLLPDMERQLFTPYDVDSYRQRGSVLCGQIYEGVYDKMMERLSAITPDLSDWMIVEGYGKTLSREGLHVSLRELCNVAVLAVLGRQNQLTSHVRGALRVGATADQLWACADAVTEWAGKEAGDRLRATIGRYA